MISKYLQKGDLILIEGRLQTRSWEDANGNQRKRTEIVAENIQLPPKNMSRGGTARPTRKPQKKKKRRNTVEEPKEEDIPVIEEEEIEEKNETNEGDIEVEDIPF